MIRKEALENGHNFSQSLKGHLAAAFLPCKKESFPKLDPFWMTDHYSCQSMFWPQYT
jgi:hypothetical protein